jgi:hypothetical protein
MKARPIDEYHEDMGDVLWWRFPINEPPYVGSPSDQGKTIRLQILGASEPFLHCDFTVGGWPGVHTHFTTIEIPEESNANS